MRRAGVRYLVDMMAKSNISPVAEEQVYLIACQNVRQIRKIFLHKKKEKSKSITILIVKITFSGFCALCVAWVRLVSALAEINRNPSYGNWRETFYSLFNCNTAKNASCGISILPTCFMRFLPSFCFCNNFFLRLISPP